MATIRTINRDNVNWGTSSRPEVWNGSAWAAIGGDNITDDPELDANPVPGSGSPCIGIGEKWWSEARPSGFGGEPFPDFDIDIGAVQSSFGAFHPKNL